MFPTTRPNLPAPRPLTFMMAMYALESRGQRFVMGFCAGVVFPRYRRLAP